MNPRMNEILRDRARAAELKRAGLTNIQIGRQLNRAKDTISKWMQAAGLAKSLDGFDERNAEIVRRLQNRETAYEIAKAMGISRGIIAGVRGRAKRDGMTFPTDGNKARHQVRARKTGARLTASAHSRAEVRGGGVAFEQIGSRQCRYPYGHPGDKDFRACGEPTTGILESYCPEHMALCWKARVAA